MVVLAMDFPIIVSLVAVSGFVWFLTIRLLRARANDVPEVTEYSRGKPFAILGFGLLMMVLGTFPYAAVGKIPGCCGVASSYAPLVALPFAIVLLGAANARMRGCRVWLSSLFLQCWR